MGPNCAPMGANGRLAMGPWGLGPIHRKLRVFQLVPEMVAYRWSRENNYFMVSSSSYLAVGGGGAFQNHSKTHCDLSTAKLCLNK